MQSLVGEGSFQLLLLVAFLHPLLPSRPAACAIQPQNQQQATVRIVADEVLSSKHSLQRQPFLVRVLAVLVSFAPSIRLVDVVRHRVCEESAFFAQLLAWRRVLLSRREIFPTPLPTLAPLDNETAKAMVLA